MDYDDFLQIGTCSWKYPSWQGLVYSSAKPPNYLAEYSKKYATVEVDQWFWSLFKGNTVVLPKKEVIREYIESVPECFTFCVKVPNSITLTHHYSNKGPLIENPWFLSVDLMHRFLDSIAIMKGKLGPLVFQFEYLNKRKMVNQKEFINRFSEFAEGLPRDFDYGVEIRNPNYLNSDYFDFLASVEMSHVFLHGYYMPPIFKVYKAYKELLGKNTIVRLLGFRRKEIEEQTGKKWGSRVDPQEKDLDLLVTMLNDLKSRRANVHLYVNNHFEGSAPRTITRLRQKLLQKS